MFPGFSSALIRKRVELLFTVINMGLTNKKEEQLKEMPTIRSSIMKSKDGALVIHKTTITDIKPVAYYNVVLEETKA